MAALVAGLGTALCAWAYSIDRRSRWYRHALVGVVAMLGGSVVTELGAGIRVDRWEALAVIVGVAVLIVRQPEPMLDQNEGPPATATLPPTHPIAAGHGQLPDER